MGHYRVSKVFVLEGVVGVTVLLGLEWESENRRLSIEEWLAESRLTCEAYDELKVVWQLFLHRPNWNCAVIEVKGWRDENVKLAGVFLKPRISWLEALEWWILVGEVVPMELA